MRKIFLSLNDVADFQLEFGVIYSAFEVCFRNGVSSTPKSRSTLFLSTIMGIQRSEALECIYGLALNVNPSMVNWGACH